MLPNKEEAGKDLGILNMGTTLGQMCGPVIMSTIVVSLGYNFAFPTAIALAIIGCFFIMAIKKVKYLHLPPLPSLNFERGEGEREWGVFQN